MDKRFEDLKKAIFNMGHTDYIEEFLGYEISSTDYSKDELDNLMDEVYQQMPDEELEVFYTKYCV